MHLQQQRIRSPDEFQLTDVNTVEHDSKHQRPSFRFIHIASEQPIHIVGIRSWNRSGKSMRYPRLICSSLGARLRASPTSHAAFLLHLTTSARRRGTPSREERHLHFS